MSSILKASRERMSPSSFGLPRKRKFVINTYRRAVAAVAYAKKLARTRDITPAERDQVLRRVHRRWPSIDIAPTRGFRP